MGQYILNKAITNTHVLKFCLDPRFSGFWCSPCIVYDTSGFVYISWGTPSASARILDPFLRANTSEFGRELG